MNSHHSTIRLVPCLLLAATASAQAPLWVPPGMTQSATDPFLDFATNPILAPLTSHARPIFAAGVHKMPSDPPGQWTLSFTIRALQGFGNPGFSGMLLAEWNPASATPLVLKHYADAVNDSFIDYNLNLEPITTDASGARTGGRYGVFDRFRSVAGVLQFEGIHLAARADDRSDFGPAVVIANVQGTNGFGDATLGYVGGQLKLFYAGIGPNAAGTPVSGILMDDLIGADTSTPMAAGNPVLVCEPLQGGVWYLHSPSLLHGADGDVEGLYVSEGDGVDRSDIYFCADLDPATPSVRAVETTSWLHSGGNAGGLALFGYRDNASTVWMVHGAWLLGDEVTPGDIADLTMSVYSPPGSPRPFAAIFGGAWLQSPASLPGLNGMLGVTPFFSLRGKRIPSADQVVRFSVPIPPLPALIGTDIPVQGLTRHTDSNGNVVGTYTNTATVRIR